MKLLNLLASFCLVLASTSASSPVKFYAMPDGPVGINEWMHFASQLCDLDTRAKYAIHLGDIHERQKICNHDFLQQPADTMQSNLLVPILMVPGGNDFYECDDQKEVWKKWTNLFLGFEGNWTWSFTLERQSGRPENFAFVLKNILFLGVHVINASVTDWDALNKLVHDDALWLKDSVLAHLDQVGAIVIMAHAFPHSCHYCEFYDTLVHITSDYSKNHFSIFKAMVRVLMLNISFLHKMSYKL